MILKKYKLLAVHYILCYAEFTSQELYVLFVAVQLMNSSLFIAIR